MEPIEQDVERLRAIHGSVTLLDPGQHLRAEHAEELVRCVVTPLRLALAEAIAITVRIEQACEHVEADTGDWGEHLEQTGAHESPEIGNALAGELWQQVGNLAFAARSELRRTERVMLAADGDHDKRVVAAESARRKLRRAIHALLDAAGAALGRDIPLTGVDTEIEAAIAVRRMYAKFRRSLPACDVDDPGQVRRALRLSAVSIAVMVGSADFAEIRAQDRQLIRAVQSRILTWAREGASDSAGRQLYLDVQTAADLLRAIDLRQELASHDQTMLARVARAVASNASASDILGQVRPALRALAGKDDELDAIADCGEAPMPAVVVERLRVHLTRLGWYPPADAAA